MNFKKIIFIFLSCVLFFNTNVFSNYYYDNNCIYKNLKYKNVLKSKTIVSGIFNSSAYKTDKTTFNIMPDFYSYYLTYNKKSLSNDMVLFFDNYNSLSHTHISINFNKYLKQKKYCYSLSKDALHIDEMYLNVFNKRVSPFFFKIGKFYQPFGNYKIYSFIPDLTTLLSKINSTGIEVGYILKNGTYFAFTGFSGNGKKNHFFGNEKNINNFIFNSGNHLQFKKLSIDIGSSYLKNAEDIDFIKNNIIHRHSVPFPKSSAYSGHLILHYHKNQYCLKYVVIDISSYRKPSAFSYTLKHSFKLFNKKSFFILGCQTTNRMNFLTPSNITIPKLRYIFGYNIDLSHNLSLNLNYCYDQSYYGRINTHIGYVYPKVFNNHTFLLSFIVHF